MFEIKIFFASLQNVSQEVLTKPLAYGEEILEIADDRSPVDTRLSGVSSV
jgi:hypothetical protein